MTERIVGTARITKGNIYLDDEPFPFSVKDRVNIEVSPNQPFKELTVTIYVEGEIWVDEDVRAS